jgi:hypothetical protein
MKLIKLTLVAMCMMGLIFSLTPQAWAAGGAVGEEGCCSVKNAGFGALLLKGELTTVYTPSGILNLDVTLRLERSGVMGTFRLNLIGLTLPGGFSNEQIACMLLNPGEPTLPPAMRPRVVDFVNKILDFFFTGRDGDPGSPDYNTRMVLTGDSISPPLTAGFWACGEFGDDCVIPASTPTRLSTIDDILIYVIDEDRFVPASSAPACSLP